MTDYQIIVDEFLYSPHLSVILYRHGMEKIDIDVSWDLRGYPLYFLKKFPFNGSTVR